MSAILLAVNPTDGQPTAVFSVPENALLIKVQCAIHARIGSHRQYTFLEDAGFNNVILLPEDEVS